MILTTTNSIEGHRIIEYKGLVTGLVIKQLKSTMTFSMDKYYKSIQDSMQELEKEALEQMKEKAFNLNASAIVGIKMDIETSATTAVISISGTAVSIA